MHDVYGHELLRDRLGKAIAASRFPQATLFVGPRGSGKQRLALWVAQTILCEAGGSQPCGECHACLQVAGLVHPDLHWFVPLALKNKSSDPDKHVAEVQSALAELMAERRAESVYGPPEATASHALAAVRYLQRIVAKKPYQGRRKVIIVGDAPRLVVQEASQEAANALLKVLEEPPADTDIILTAESVHGLLPTIRSRTVPVRVGPVPTDRVVAFATEVLGRSGDSARPAAIRANGRIGSLVAGEDKSGASRRADALLAALRKGPVGLGTEALKQATWGARGSFTELLDALAFRMRNELEKRSEAGTGDLRKPLQALKIISQHRATAAQNVNPQLALAVMASELSALR